MKFKFMCTKYNIETICWELNILFNEERVITISIPENADYTTLVDKMRKAAQEIENTGRKSER